MQNKFFLAAAIGGLSTLGFGTFAPSVAQVNGLTFSSFNPATRELTLTNSRGVTTLPTTFNTVNDATNADVSWFGGFFINIDSVNSNPSGNVCNPGCSTTRWVPQFVDEYTLSGFDSSGQPFTSAPTQWTVLRLNAGSNSGSLNIAAGAGIIFNFVGVTLPDGFTFIPPVPSGSTPVSPPLNNPTLNTAALTTPEPTTQPGNPAAQALPENGNVPSQRVFRPNGVHTRIVPEWSPGLYQ
ncbi:MAG: hypothetical protein ACPGVO_21785 [Spirulinaceae cyanobacterium]